MNLLIVQSSKFKRNNNCYSKELNNLPNSLEILELPEKYLYPISNIPLGLKIISCSKDYKYIGNFADYKVESYE